MGQYVLTRGSVCSVHAGFHTLSCFDRVPSSTEVMEDDRETGRGGEGRGEDEGLEERKGKERRGF